MAGVILFGIHTHQLRIQDSLYTELEQVLDQLPKDHTTTLLGDLYEQKKGVLVQNVNSPV